MILSDFSQRHSSWSEPVWLLDALSLKGTADYALAGSCLSGCLIGEVLPWGLEAGVLPCGLLSSCHVSK